MTVIALLAAGCGRSPKKVFGDLKDAALKKDAKAVWANLSLETKAVLIKRSGELYAEKNSTGSAYKPTEADGRQYLSMLTSNLESLAVEYIRSLRVASVTVKGDTAEVALASLRFGPPEKPLTFRKVDGKWVWDARDVLDWYLENRSYLSSMAQGGL
jgi:hypothetical protein